MSLYKNVFEPLLSRQQIIKYSFCLSTNFLLRFSLQWGFLPLWSAHCKILDTNKHETLWISFFFILSLAKNVLLNVFTNDNFPMTNRKGSKNVSIFTKAVPKNWKVNLYDVFLRNFVIFGFVLQLYPKNRKQISKSAKDRLVCFCFFHNNSYKR